jgi:hypothetical protein
MATTTATDLMKSGDTTVKGTFGKSSSVVKWVVLAEVIAGGIMYDDQKREVPVRLRHHFDLYYHRYVGRRLLTGYS